MLSILKKAILKRKLEYTNKLLISKIKKLGFKFDKDLEVWVLKDEDTKNYLINVVSKDFTLKEIEKLTNKLNKKNKEYILNINAANPEKLNIHYYEFKFINGKAILLSEHEEKIKNGR